MADRMTTERISLKLGHAFMSLTNDFQPLVALCSGVRKTDWRNWTPAEAGVVWKTFQFFRALQDRGLVELEVPKNPTIRTLSQVKVRRVRILDGEQYINGVVEDAICVLRSRGLGMGGNVVRLEERRQSA